MADLTKMAAEHGLLARVKKPKHLKEFHAKEQHGGGYHVRKHSGKPSEPHEELHANDMSDVHAQLEDHMGSPNEGEAELAQSPAPMALPGMGGMGVA
jgi:hypothetical protein